MPSPVDTAWLILKTDIQLGDKRDPDDPNAYNLDLTERFLQDDREKNFLDNFKEATEEQNMYQNYYDDDSEFAGYYDDMTRTQEEMRQEAMDRLDDEDRSSAGRVIDRIKDRDINNAIVAAHLGQFPSGTKEELEDMRQQMEADPRDHVMNTRPALFNTREGFYGPQRAGPRSQMSSLPLGPNTKLKSYNVDLPQSAMATPHEKAWNILKFGYPSVEGANYPMREKPEEGKKDMLAEALARARKQKPDPPIEFAPKLPKPPKMPEDPYQMQLPPEFVGDATVGGDFRNADFSRLKL